MKQESLVAFRGHMQLFNLAAVSDMSPRKLFISIVETYISTIEVSGKEQT